MTLDHYDERGWGSREQRSVLEARELLAVELLLATRPHPGARIVDLGCGDGLMLARLHETLPGAELVGYDLSESQVTRARTRLPQARIAQADLSASIPEPDGQLDVVYAGEVIEHLYSPDDFLDEAARILRPGGTLLVTTPNLLSWFNRGLAVTGLGPVYVEYSTRNSSAGMGPLRRIKAGGLPVGHIRVLTARALRDLLRSAEFVDIVVRGAAFEYGPRGFRRLDSVVSRAWPAGAGILVALARKR